MNLLIHLISFYFFNIKFILHYNSFHSRNLDLSYKACAIIAR